MNSEELSLYDTSLYGVCILSRERGSKGSRNTADVLLGMPEA